MKYIKKFSKTFLLVALICSFVAALPPTYAATSKSNQEEALSFVTNVLPFDTSKDDITLTNNIKNLPSEWASYSRETFDYTFKYSENTL
jgi:guanyl-specific ribonuclease Sa